MAKDSIEKSQSEDGGNSIEAFPVVQGGTPSEAEPSAIEIVTAQELPAADRKPGERRELVRSASLVMFGNLGSSVMGMVRQAVIAYYGAGVSGPFQGALSPAQKFNDLLVNGSVGGALIPTFNDYAAPEKREELRRLVFTIVNLILLIMIASSIIFFFIAPWFVYNVLEPGFNAADKQLTLNFARIIFFSLVALGPFAVLQASLYARKEFGWTAFAATSYHVGIIIGAIVTGLFGQYFFGQYGLAFGVLLGTVGEVALLIPGLRNQHLRYMFVLDLKHPALKNILKLYAPVAVGYLVTTSFGFLDQSLASNTPCEAFMSSLGRCGTNNWSAMQFATTLIQFPIGLVAAALTFAVLPTLTTHAREGQMERFKDTLLLGFRLGLLLMIPATAGLIVLGNPIVGAIFQRHNFKPYDTLLTALALRNYAYQLPFIAIDQLLIAAFYARKNTIIPVAVGVVSVLGYLLVALPFYRTLGMPALALANAAQNALHAVILLVLLRMAIGSIHVRKMIPTVLKILLATAVMVAIGWGLQLALEHISWFADFSTLSRVVTIVLVGSLAAGAYFAVVMLLKVEEVGLLKGAVLAKLGKK